MMMTAAAIEQRRNALKRANAVRTRQSRFTSTVGRLSTKEGAERVATAIEEHDVESFPIGRLLMSIHAVAHRKMARLLLAADIRSESRRVDDLTDRQRARLVALLRARAW